MKRSSALTLLAVVLALAGYLATPGEPATTCTPISAATRTLANGSQIVDWSVRSTCVGTRPVAIERDSFGRLSVRVCYLDPAPKGGIPCSGPQITLGEWCSILRALPVPPIAPGTPTPSNPGEGDPGGPPVLAHICP